MRDNIIKKLFQRNRIINRIIILYKERERHTSFGDENPDKTFFVIRRNAPNAGLFSFVITNVGWMKYALDKGYIPVVDMQNYYNTYITEEAVGRVNAWDYYFKQPCGYSVEDIKNSKNIIISSLDAAEENPNPMDKVSFSHWQQFAQRYLIFSDGIEAEIAKRENELFQKRRILGVLCRGTDYTATKPTGHPIQPKTDDVIRKAEEMMNEYSCENIFLATEDEEILETFSNRFGEKLLFMPSRRYRATGVNNINELADKNDKVAVNPLTEKHKKGFDYAVTIGLLAKCTCLLAGQVSGTTGTLLLTKGYEHEYLFDLGLYD